MPRISAILVKDFLPVWVDIEKVGAATAAAFKATGLAFTNLVGFITGDTSIEGTAFSFEHLAVAVTDVLHPFAVLAEAIANVEEFLAHLTSAVALALSGDFKGAGTELGMAFHAATAKAVGGVAGGVAGGVLGGAATGALGGSLFGPIGTVVGGVGGAISGALFGAGVGSNAADDFFGSDASISSVIDQQADAMGVPRSLAHAVARTESGEQQYDKNGKLITSATGAQGIMQLTRSTAAALGVDRGDAGSNVKGGVTLLAQLLKHYNGNVADAVGGYHEGQAKMDAVLAGRATLSPEAKGEIAQVMRRMGTTGDVHVGSIVIHIDGATATNEHVANVVVSRLNTLKNRQTQRNLYELQDQGVTA
jgi:hypothetical protein